MVALIVTQAVFLRASEVIALLWHDFLFPGDPRIDGAGTQTAAVVVR